MGDVITRFRLETNQWDSALRDASQGLANLTKQLTLAGNDFNKFAQKDVEVARALGQVESGATNLKDKLRDLVSAYNNVAKAYNNLTKEQQQSDFGKAMASSLEQLQQRITATKNELYSITDSTKQTGDGLGDLNNIFGISITKLAGWGTAIATAKGALDVAKDAFMQSETNIDDWGRAVEGAKGAYDIFINTINNGNWSNFFQNLSTAINGAQDLYDALDRLSSIKSNNQAAIAIVQAQIQQLRVLKQQGKDVDDQIKEATQRLKALQSQSINAGKTAGTTSMREVIRNEANSIQGGAQVSDRSIQAAIDGILKKGNSEFEKYKRTVEAYEKQRGFYTKVATNRTNSLGNVTTTYSYQFDINKLTEEQQKQYKLAKAITEGETRIQEGISIYAQAVQEGAQSAREEFRGNRYALQGSHGGNSSGRNSTEKVVKELNPLQDSQKMIASLTEEALTADEDRLKIITQEIASLKQQEQYYKNIQDQVNGIKKTEAQVVTGVSITNSAGMSQYISQLQNDLKNADFGSALYNSIAEQLTDMTSLQNLVGEALKQRLGTTMFDTVDELGRDFWTRAMIGGVDNIDWQEIVDKINRARKDAGLDEITLNFTTGDVSGVKDKKAKGEKDEREQSLGQMVNNVSTIARGLQELGVEIPDGFMKVLSVLQITTTILTAMQTLMGVTATTSAIKSIPIIGWFLHNGGVVHAANGFSGTVPGNYFSGDQVPAMLDSGETVLSRAQSGIIAAALNVVDNAAQGGAGETRVDSDQLVLTIRNGARRRGMTMGEYLGL